MKIYLLDNSDLSRYEALNKGYRNDVYIECNNNFYKVNVYDFVRLQQDAISEIEEYGYYSIDTNIVIVKEVSEDCIKLTVSKLFKEGYFMEITAI